MGQAERDHDRQPGPPEAFDGFYVREYPTVVGLLQGLLCSRIVAEELAQEAFLVAYRDWDRVSGLDNPRAWVRKVALNHPSSSPTSTPRSGSATQVDAAVGLREIVHAGRPQPPDPTAAPAAQPAPPAPAGVLLRRTQRLALAVNLLLVLALGVTLVVVAGGARRGVGPGASTQRTAATTPPTSIPPATTLVTRTVVQVPEACLEAAELADEIISALTRNKRDSRLAMALRDYSVANQACRQEARLATPPTTAP